MSENKKFSIIVAIDNNSLIGIKEYEQYSMPWPQIKEDMLFFQKTTTDTETESQYNAIIMGYNTWKTLPLLYKKNTKRQNIIISRTADIDKPIGKEVFVKSFDAALEFANILENLHKIFVIGGSTIYDKALGHPMLERIYLTYIKNSYPIENVVQQYIRFPLDPHNVHQKIFNDNSLVELEYCSEDKHDIWKNINYCFKTFRIINNYFSLVYSHITKNTTHTLGTSHLLRYFEPIMCMDEYQYIEMVRKVMNEGVFKETRNAITKSIFGYQMRFDLSKGYPLLTVKKSYPKSIFEELMWIIRGQTNAKILQEKGVNIWNKNSSKEFLEKCKLPYKENDCGPIYGFQMRHFGAKYIDCGTDYTGQGVDQLQQCIDLIRTDPGSRRIIIDLWNCMDTDKQSLPSCHTMYNFGVDLYDKPINGKKGKLNCHLFQRSWDILLGWNTTTAALLTYLLAHHCDLDPGVLVHSITDVHLYKTHIDSGAVDELLKRWPRKAPKLKILNIHERIEDYVYEDLVLENYYPCPAVIAEMVA